MTKFITAGILGAMLMVMGGAQTAKAAVVRGGRGGVVGHVGFDHGRYAGRGFVDHRYAERFDHDAVWRRPYVGGYYDSAYYRTPYYYGGICR